MLGFGGGVCGCVDLISVASTSGFVVGCLLFVGCVGDGVGIAFNLLVMLCLLVCVVL